MVQRAYRYRFYPTVEQITQLSQTFGSCRYVYNYFLDLKQQTWKEQKKTLSYLDCSKLLTHLKVGAVWLAQISSVCLQQALRHLEKAFSNFFNKRSKFPNFKKKHSGQSASFTKNAFTYKEGAITLAKHKKPLAIRWSRRFEGEPISLTVSRDSAGRYFVSILVEEEIKPLQQVKKSIGIDLGLTNMICDHDGNKQDPALFLKSDLKKLKVRQQTLSRRKKGSKNWQRAKKRISAVHAKIKDKRLDRLHQLSKQLIIENQVIAVEDLNVKKMMSKKRLAQRIGDSAWSTLLNFLKYKCQWYGRRFVQIDRFFPSSKLCGDCGRLNEDLTLKEREWSCKGCCKRHDRDTNAARNIHIEGLRLVSTVGLTGC